MLGIPLSAVTATLISLVEVAPLLSVTEYRTLYSPTFLFLTVFSLTFILLVKLPSSSSVSVTPSNGLKLSLSFIVIYFALITGTSFNFSGFIA